MPTQVIYLFLFPRWVRMTLGDYHSKVLHDLYSEIKEIPYQSMYVSKELDHVTNIL